MMSFGILKGLMIGAACLPLTIAEARTVVYPIDSATLTATGEKLGIDVSPDPAKGAVDVALEMAPTVDHEAVRGGLMCSAWSIENPISKLLHDMVAAHNPSGKLADATPTAPLLSIKRASTLGRCVMTGEMEGTCLTRVSIDATLRPAKGGAEIPVHAQVERQQKAVGMCNGLAIGTGLISREAAIALLKASDTRLAEAAPPKP